ncbi:MAG TPA: hypothetical protein IAC47_03215 [Candidatus Onthomorpha intestinigallinarum]|uniref:Glycosyltransferase 2-like domain-containing protein n=1 Tax=Candidatus Onthomorpha intestinigallinarum TaxID=2840880 RepID=A0A9D1UGS4_9BACT|nr:hypothetical protein [Candidatus Onthomorpha intestinigallinarum]
MLKENNYLVSIIMPAYNCAKYIGESIECVLIQTYTNWEYAHEIIDDNINGFIVSYDNPEKQKVFNERLIRLYNDRDLLERMKNECLSNKRKIFCSSSMGSVEKVFVS